MTNETSTKANKSLIKAIIGIVTKNSSQEKELKTVFKKLGIPAKLGMNCLNMINYESNDDVFSSVKSICDTHSTKPALIASLCSLLRYNTSNVLRVAEGLNFNDDTSADMFITLSALATMQFDQIENRIPEIAKKIESPNEALVKDVLQVACGKLSPELLNRIPNFDIKQKHYDVIFSVHSIVKLGRAQRKLRVKINYKQVLSNFDCILNKATAVLGSKDDPLSARKEKDNLNTLFKMLFLASLGDLNQLKALGNLIKERYSE